MNARYFVELLHRIGNGTTTVEDVELVARLLKRWIVLDEALPEPLTDVLVVWSDARFDADATVDIGYRKPDGRWVLTGTEPEKVIMPTHWMPLPPLPFGLDARYGDIPLGMEAGMPS